MFVFINIVGNFQIIITSSLETLNVHHVTNLCVQGKHCLTRLFCQHLHVWKNVSTIVLRNLHKALLARGTCEKCYSLFRILIFLCYYYYKHYFQKLQN